MIKDKTHICRWLLEHEDSPFYAIKIRKNGEDYFLEYKSFSSKQDVISGEADYVGEEMSRYSLRINFCPFCGQNLDKLRFNDDSVA
jgi:hypothetical protein